MFNNCKNLTAISGSILSLTDDPEWNTATTAGHFFFTETFADTAITYLSTGSFDTSNITTVNDYFFDMTFMNTQLMNLPQGSFITSNISGTVGNFVFSHTFRNTRLTQLPTGSFDTSKITSVGHYFFSSTFRNTRLTSLPAGSFDISKITSVGNDFFSSTFQDTRLASLPTGSFSNTLLSQSELDKPGVFDSTFYSTNLEFDISTLEPFASIEPGEEKYTFSNTNVYVPSTAGWTPEQIARREVQLRDTTTPTAIITYYPSTGTRTSGTVEVLLQLNKIISPLYGRTATGTNAYMKHYSENINESVELQDPIGNTGTAIINISHIDTTPPTLHSLTQDTLTTGSKKLTVTATDTGAGLHPEAYSFDDGLTRQIETTKTFTTATTGVIKVRDILGNVSSTGYSIHFNNTVTPPPSTNPPTINQGG
jgi:hypothetical protein